MGQLVWLVMGKEIGNTATITKAAPADLFPSVNKKAGQKNLFF